MLALGPGISLSCENWCNAVLSGTSFLEHLQGTASAIRSHSKSQVLLLATPKLPAHMQLQLQHLDRLVAMKQQSNQMTQ